jgi:outer membrane protein insertion porin family
LKHLAIGIAIVLIALSPHAKAQTGESPIVREIRFEGIERVSEELLLPQLELKVGQPYNQRAVARDIGRLYDLGHFVQIRVDKADVSDGVAITYIVEEKQLISKVRIIGADKMKERRIRSELTMREGDSFILDACNEERQAILTLYQSKGFANTVVDTIISKVGNARIILTYAIEEGKKARIRSVNINGNDALSNRSIKKLMKTKPAKWFLGGRFDEAKLEMDLQEILNEYGNHGRLEADVLSTDLAYTPNGKGLSLDLFLSEGPEYHVGELRIANNVVYDDEEILALIEVHVGDVHNKGQVEKDATETGLKYQESGYVNAFVSPQVTLDGDNKTTHVVHNVSEGELMYIREVLVSGNEITKEDIIRREIKLKPGDRYDGTALRQSERGLARTRYFETLHLSLDPIEDSEIYTRLLADVEEGKTGSFQFGVGFSTDQQFGGFGELRMQNFDILNPSLKSWPPFSGGGQEFSIRLNIGQLYDQFRLSFTEPEFLGYPLAVGFDLFDESLRLTGASRYLEERTGAQIRMGKTLSPYNTVRALFRYQSTDLSDMPIYNDPEINEQRGESDTLSIRGSVERATMDSFIDPSNGAKHVLALEVAGFGAEHEFMKLEHDSTWYWALTAEKRWVLSLRSRNGVVDAYGNSSYVPLQDRFFLGGTSTVRGYENRDIGPKAYEVTKNRRDDIAVGGYIRFVTNLELKYKVTDMLRVYGFFDSGGLWDDFDEISLSDARHSVGVGFSVDIPGMGPMRVDYGFPVNADSDQGSGRLHLMTGLRF